MLLPIFCLSLALTLPADEPAASLTPIVGRKIADFTLSDYRGKRWSLAEFKDAKVVVVAFLGTECPIVRLYARRLQEFEDSYRQRGVVVVGIDANQQDSLAEMEHFARTHGIQFPFLKDPGNQIADRLAAQRTPEVYVLDRDRIVRYHGRIDDQYTYETQRSRVEQDYLATAVQELLADQLVTTAETELFGCHIGRVLSDPQDNGVTYSRQISRILQRRCVECHRNGEIAPFALTDYDEVVGWAEMIEEVVRQQRMPPWHASPEHGSFAEDRRMSDDERQLIYQWVADGAPRGDPQDLPVPAEYVAGWQLPQPPDVVIKMRAEPFQVPAAGPVEYQYFVVDPEFREDKWVRMAEVQPGNRQVVHHVLVFAQAPGSRPISGEQGGFLAAYVPGLRARPFPEGMAKRVRAQSKLVFQVHYTPVGTEQADLSSLGLVFASPADVTHQVITAAAVETDFAIPPHDGNFAVESQSRPAPVSLQLLAMMPHMHLRGKSFRYEARYPGGTSEILLDVPRYDFNWQTTYRLATPKVLPAGTRIHCLAHYDNSEHNLANPAPDKTVRWGDQTWDEMMIGYFDVAVPVR